MTQGQIKIEIEGMSCGGCAAKISSALQRDTRVSSAVIDYATQTGVVDGSLSRGDIKKIIESVGYHLRDDREAEDDPDLRPSHRLSDDMRQLLVAAVLALTVALMAMGPWTFARQSWWEAGMTTVFLIWPARGFFSRAIKQLRKGFVTMDTLVSLGMVSAWLVSIIMMHDGHEHLYFESAVMIGFFVLLGKTLEDVARKKSIGEVDRLVR